METWSKLCTILLKTMLGFGVTLNSEHAPISDLLAKRPLVGSEQGLIHCFALPSHIPNSPNSTNSTSAFLCQQWGHQLWKWSFNCAAGMRKTSLESLKNIHFSSFCKFFLWWLWLTTVLFFGFATIGINSPSTFSSFNQRSESMGDRLWKEIE